jgi:2-polyprenyl-3-methyl-5-hydroxy-6-metoxy-1,4-benzoquinol methylase
VIAYDSCKEAIDNAIDKENIKYLTGEFDEILLDDIQVLVMVEVIEHMEHSDAVKFIKMVQEHPCNIVLTTPNGNMFPYHPQSPSEYRGFHKWHYTEQELKDLLSGYKYVDVSGHAWDPKLGQFTGFTAYASNKIEWSDDLLFEV